MPSFKNNTRSLLMHTATSVSPSGIPMSAVTALPTLEDPTKMGYSVQAGGDPPPFLIQLRLLEDRVVTTSVRPSPSFEGEGSTATDTGSIPESEVITHYS